MLYYGLKNKIVLPQSPPVYGHAPLTEKILSLNDIAVLLTAGNNAVVHCSESVRTILGIPATDVMEKGWHLLFERIHPNDQKLLTKKVHPQLRRFIRRMDPAERESLVFNYTFRIRNKHEQYIVAALENQTLEWNGRGRVYMSVLKDISPYADRSKMLLNVRKKQHSEKLIQKEYVVRAAGFSPRETQIIHYIADGLTSVQIAEKLFVSAETVRAHRKHIMQKSGCKSSAELVSFALHENIV